MEYLINNAMNINKIQELSKLYNEVALYFSKYEPQQFTAYSVPYYYPDSKIPTVWKVFKPESMSCTVCQFADWFRSLKTALYGIVLSYREEIFQDTISYYFKSYLYIPKSTVLIKCGDADNVELLNMFMNATEFINNISGHGLKDEYESFKEEAERERASLMPEEQVNEENYIDDELDMFIQKIRDDSNTLAHEVVHKLLNSGAVGLMQTDNQVKETQWHLPRELDTAEARRVLKKAVESELIEISKNGYIWNESNALLACMCGVLYCGDTLKTDAITKEKIIKLGSTLFPERTLCNLFGVKNLGQSRLQKKDKTPPKGWFEMIEPLFNEAAK